MKKRETPGRTVKPETLRTLTDAELRLVAGGRKAGRPQPEYF